MLFRRDTLEGIADGTISLAFRRWRSPAATTGGTQRTSHGVVRFGRVERIEVETIDVRDARAGGYCDLDTLLAELTGRAGDLYRVELAGIDTDPRERLREQTEVEPDILDWLTRIDWALPILRAIEQAPEVRAADIAEPMGLPRDRF